MQRDIDVLVTGAGPVGLFAAHALAKKGVPVGIVDTGIWPCAHSYALALHPCSVELLCKAGLADNIVGAGQIIQRIALYDYERERASIPLDAQHPMVVLPQRVLEAELEAELRHAGVRVDWGHKVAEIEPAGDRVRVTLNRYERESRGYVVARSEWAITKTWTVEVPFVIGTDGYDSIVRKSIGAQFPEVAPSSYYAVFEFRPEAPITDEVRIIFGDGTADVLWPLGNGWFRWSFQLPDYTDPEVERLAAYRERYGDPSDRFKDRMDDSRGQSNLLTDSRLHELVAARAKWFAGSAIAEIGWRTVVRFERRIATSFGKDGCWIAGDSAHLGNPIAVHSLNLGLAEAKDLATMLAGCVTSDHMANGSMNYDSRWQDHWRRLLGSVGIMSGGADPWVTENRNRIVSCLPAYGNSLAEMAAHIGLTV